MPAARSRARRVPPKQERLPGAAAAKPVLWTIGYEGRTVDELVAALQAAGVGHLADVRELPMSRKPDFNKGALSRAVEEAGLRYTSLRSLGAPRAVRHRFRSGGEWDLFSAAYLAHLDTVEGDVAALAAAAKAGPTAILCFERAAKDCHRSLLAKRLARHGLAIVDL